MHRRPSEFARNPKNFRVKMLHKIQNALTNQTTKTETILKNFVTYLDRIINDSFNTDQNANHFYNFQLKFTIQMDYSNLANFK